MFFVFSFQRTGFAVGQYVRLATIQKYASPIQKSLTLMMPVTSTFLNTMAPKTLAQDGGLSFENVWSFENG